MKVVAVIVTFNRKRLLLENVQRLLSQTINIHKIIIVDNCSTDGTKEYLNKNGILDNKNIYYHILEKNIGGAGGFFWGTKLAYESKADLVWLMDDDGKPYNNYTLENILNLYKKTYVKNKLQMLNSLVVCDEKNLSFGLYGCRTLSELQSKNDNNNVLYNYINPFNGTLVSRELIEKIGYPNEKFFIKGDDVDYRIRAEKAGAIIATCIDSIYYHPAMPVSYKKIVGRKVRVLSEAPWKEYYRARNHTYIRITNKQYKKWINHLTWQLKNIILSENEVFKKLRLYFKGIKDGILGNLGPSIKP